MEQIKTIADANQFKVLGDKRRVRILQYLMDKPATLSQLGRLLGIHPAKVRYHLKQLEGAGFVSLVSTQIERGFVEKYYQASARAYRVNLAILPRAEDTNSLIFTGSHDLALDLLAQSLREQKLKSAIHTLPVGSLDGLIGLRQGVGQVAGIHLLDPVSGEYNLPYIRHFFPGEKVHLYTLAHRQQGLIVAAGNPLGLQDLTALAGPNVRFINRRRGSGTRLWLDRQLELENISPEHIDGYAWEVDTHTQVAQAVEHGQADAGIGLEAAAVKFDLDFVPLFEERYDLVVPDENLGDPALSPALDYLQTASFRKAVREMGGYSTREMGSEVPV